ncbi:mucin-17-like [Ruditapes philippinarum]|uniref:mucin-17-like n=1 Tax=Ruditapes philippinarum TaxID=129788 RepID=UPI00295C1537|nr:mucin-17-like [Ruditapes philippinarum]
MDRVYFLGYVLLLLIVNTVLCSNDCGKLSLEYIQTGETVSAKIYFNPSADLEWYTWRRVSPFRHLKNSTKYVISENPHTIIIKNLASSDDGRYDTECTLTNGIVRVSANDISISLNITYTTEETSRDSVSSRDHYSTTRLFETRITQGNVTPSSTKRMSKTTERTISQYTGLFATTKMEPDNRTPLSYTSETVSSEGGTLSSSTETVSSEGGTLSSSTETVSSEEGTLSSSTETVSEGASSEGASLPSSTETVSSERASSEEASLSSSTELEISTLPYTKEVSSQDVRMSSVLTRIFFQTSRFSEDSDTTTPDGKHKKTTEFMSAEGTVKPVNDTTIEHGPTNVSTSTSFSYSTISSSEVLSTLSTLSTTDSINISTGHETDKSCVIEETGQTTNILLDFFITVTVVLIIIIIVIVGYGKRKCREESFPDRRNENMEQRNCFTNATYVTVEKKTTSNMKITN